MISQRIAFCMLAVLLLSGSEMYAQKQSNDQPEMNVYFLSGLGADKRVFSKLKLDEKINVHHIEWIKPERKETLAHYAGRLVAQMDTTKPFQLVGLSFGGMIASEIADIVKPEQIVIISSTATGIPVSHFYRGLTGFLLLSPFAAPILKTPNRIAYRYFGADTPELKAILKDILKDTDSRFLKWALRRTRTWSRAQRAPDLYQIHGDADQLISINLVKPDAVIKGGGHLMVYAQAEEISAILNRKLLQEFKAN